MLFINQSIHFNNYKNSSTTRSSLDLLPNHLTENINIKYQDNDQLYDIAGALVFLIINSFDSTIENKCVELASAIHGRRKSLYYPKVKIPLCDIFGEMTLVIGDLWQCEYLVSFFDLPSNTRC